MLGHGIAPCGEPRQNVLGEEGLLLVGQSCGPIAIARFQGRALGGDQVGDEAQHEPQMVVGLGVKALHLQAVALVGGPHGQGVAAEQVAVGLHIEGFQA